MARTRALLTAVLALITLPGPLLAAAELRNQLADHPSPYLAMHGQDPVAWQRWGAEAVAAARRENKPLFVSVGYFSCYWCHVMHRESYLDPAIAALLNRAFIPVKVDRETEPALDAILMDFTEATLQRAGWPLNAFLTPEGYPLTAVLYLPPEEFRAALERIAALWADDHEALARLARLAYDELQTLTRPPAPETPSSPAELRRQLRAAAWARHDPLAGGFGEQAKFPSSPQIEALLRLQRLDPDPRLAQFLRLTLNQMAHLGLRDHLEGGFFRYTVDPTWRIPHFEKMLYDNAQLARIYLLAAEVLGAPEYRAVARDTLDFVLTHMAAPGGGYISALSAVDAAGVEGGYYLLPEAELTAQLPAETLAVARLAWRLEGPPALEEGHHPLAGASPTEIAEALDLPVDRVEATLAQARMALIAMRQRHGLPRDEKVIAAWNGMLLEALAAAAELDPRYREAGSALARFIGRELWRGDHLVRGVRAGQSLGAASLGDYAQVAAGLAAWARAAGNDAAARLAWDVATTGWTRFHGEQGWRLDQGLPVPLARPVPAVVDGAEPSPSAVLAATLLELATRRDAPEWHERARSALRTGAAASAADPFWYASHIEAFHRVGESRQNPAPGG